MTVEFDRVVQVRAVRADGGVSFGTGYLIAARLVLTAGHVLPGGPGSRAEVRCPDAAPGGFVASVRWRQVTGALDAALAEIDDPAWVPPPSWSAGRGMQRFGELVTTVPGQAATARGFPRLQRESGGRFDEQVHGRISPGTGELAGRYEIVSDDPLPAPAGDGRSQWAGMSGAAVFCGALLAGMIRADRGAWHGSRLTATRIRDVLAIPEAAAVIGAHRGQVLVVEPVELADVLDAAPVVRDLRSPAMLLRAEAEAVGFRGRAAERELLLEWFFQDRTPVRVLTGPGGQGKSRVARWMLAAAREHGHPAGVFASGAGDERLGDLPDLAAFTRVRGPVLVVVDYAESRPLLIRRLIQLSLEAGGRVRLLLLARAAGPWKTEPLGASAMVHETLAKAPETELGPLDVTAAGRADTFADAVRDLAGLLGQVHGHQDADWPRLAHSVPPPGGLGAERYQTTLSVQMAALTGLLQSGPTSVPADPGDPVEAILLRHEERYWDRTARTYHLDTLPGLVRREAIAASCLCGAASREQAEATLARLGYLTPEKALAAALWLHQLYTAPAGRFLGSLQPDRVAEFHASALVSEAPGLLEKLLGGDAGSGQQIQAITVLARAAVAHDSGDRPAASQATLDGLITALDEIRPEREVLQAVIAALPRYSQVLAGLAVRLAEDLTDPYRRLTAASPGIYDADLAASLQNLSIRYTDASLLAEALSAIDEAVMIRRRLAAADPGQWGKLNAALLTLAACYDALGMPDKARAAEAEGAVGPPLASPPMQVDERTGNQVWMVQPRAVGVIVPPPGTASGERNLVLFSRQVPLNAVREMSWATTEDNQAVIEIVMTECLLSTEGHDEDLDYVHKLPPFRIYLPPGQPAGHPINVTFGIDLDGSISVKAFDGHNGTELRGMWPSLKVLGPG